MTQLTKEEKKRVQEQLVAAGFDVGDYGPKNDGIDGIIGNDTRAAIKAFEEANGLEADGRLDNQTLAKLFADGKDDPASELKKGSRGADVSIMQEMLREVSERESNDVLNPQGVDGKFGPKTEAAVKAFQELNGIEATGKFDEKTREALVAAYNEEKKAKETEQDKQEEQVKEQHTTAVEEATSPDAEVAENQPEEVKKKLVGNTAESDPEPAVVTASAKLPDILQTQVMLNAVGYEPGILDGKDGNKTQAALKKFQTANDVPATEFMNMETAIKLTSAFEQAQAKQLESVKAMSDKLLSFGSKGEDAAAWNRYLVAQNYLDPADIAEEPDRIGNASFEATKLWQTHHSIGVDGKVGPQSRATAIADLEKPAHEQLVATTSIDFVKKPARPLTEHVAAEVDDLPSARGLDKRDKLTVDLDRIAGRQVTGEASWYGGFGGQDGYQGGRTASGIRFDRNMPFIAVPKGHRDLYGTVIKVTNNENGNTAYGLAADTGSFHLKKYGSEGQGRVLDVSRSMAKELDFKGKGHANVTWEVDVVATMDWRNRNNVPYTYSGVKVTATGKPIELNEIPNSAALVASTVEPQQRMEAANVDKSNPVIDSEQSADATPATKISEEKVAENARS